MSAFLPERLRPARERRKRGRRLIVMAVFPGLLTLLPLWRLSAVEVLGSPPLPAEAVSSLKQLEGRFPLTLGLESLKRELETWPGVASVDVTLELPGTLRVTAKPAVPVASVAVGRGWHGVDSRGHLTGPLDSPRPPVLDRFHHQPAELRRGLAIAARLAEATGTQVETVEPVVNTDYLVTLTRAGLEPWRGTVLVRELPTAAEAAWCSYLAAGQPLSTWGDLRHQSRMVLRSDHDGETAPDVVAAVAADSGGPP